MKTKEVANSAPQSVRDSEISNKQISTLGSFILILLVLVSILMCVIWNLPMHSAIFISLLFSCIFGLVYKFKWLDLQEMIFGGIKDSIFLLILMPLIGVVIGQFIIGGVVPSMIFYGVKYLNVKTFYIFAPLFTAIVAMSIGTSWGTASTIGLAMMSIGTAMGIDKSALAATIIGALFCGEIVSPLAGSTNLTLNLFKVNYKEYLKKIRIPLLISFIISMIYNYTINVSSSVISSTEAIDQVLLAIKSNYMVNIGLLLIPFIIIFLTWRGVKIIPVLTIGATLSMFSAIFIQGVPIKTVLNTIYSGPPAINSHIILESLVKNGGLTSMMSISTLLLMSLGLAGLLEKMGVLKAIMYSIKPYLVNNPASLLIFTLFSGIFLSMVAGSQTLAIMLLVKLVYDSYEKSNINKAWGGVMVMASAAVIPPLIPWNINGLFLTKVLGVSTFSYFKHSIFSLGLPIVVIMYYFIVRKKGEVNVNN